MHAAQTLGDCSNSLLTGGPGSSETAHLGEEPQQQNAEAQHRSRLGAGAEANLAVLLAHYWRVCPTSTPPH
jgi:hypothetical protein